MGRTVRARPVDLAPSPWPSARSDDALGEYARLWVLRLIEVVADRSIRSVAQGAACTIRRWMGSSRAVCGLIWRRSRSLNGRSVRFSILSWVLGGSNSDMPNG